MLKRVRRAQTISPFGVGAIMDFMGESLIATDITYWKSDGEIIHEPRLEKLLRVGRLKMAPTVPEDWRSRPEVVPYFRFPRWLFCPVCRRMTRWSIEDEATTDGKVPRCRYCAAAAELVPMRFVMACPRGHLDDIPWELWAHSLNLRKCEKPQLEFRTRAGGGGLEFLEVVCITCKSGRNLKGIATPNALKELHVFCTGRQPWERWKEKYQRCNAVPQVLQRGATNLTFPLIESSIDIPPFSLWANYSDESRQVTSTSEFTLIKANPDHPIVRGLINMIASKLDMEVEEVQRIVRQELKSDANNLETDERERDDRAQRLSALLEPEYQAFLAPDETSHSRDRFIKRRVELQPYISTLPMDGYGRAVGHLIGLVDRVVQVTRLREVRVLTGFSRLAPTTHDPTDTEGSGRFATYGGPSIAPKLVEADLGQLSPADRWYPAMEVYGEGIFLSLNEAALNNWENNPEVQSRAKMLAGRLGVLTGYLPFPSPRQLLLHTLSHLLVRQLSFECGYSIASLRERIYASAPDSLASMAGILIYTAAGDSEGTLGGLVREGDAERILPTILAALQQADWCSADPLCRESSGQGPDALNLAACHACALLPETSCIMSNRLLDRVTLIGSLDVPEIGLFAKILQELHSSFSG